MSDFRRGAKRQEGKTEEEVLHCRTLCSICPTWKRENVLLFKKKPIPISEKLSYIFYKSLKQDVSNKPDKGHFNILQI